MPKKKPIKEKHEDSERKKPEPPKKKTTKYDLAEFLFDMANIDT